MSDLVVILGLATLFVLAFLFFFVIIQVGLALSDAQKKPR